jgi:hypothetical protein
MLQLLDVRPERLPIPAVRLAFLRFHRGECSPSADGRVAAQCVHEQLTLGNEPPAFLRVGGGNCNEKLGSSKLAEPKTNVRDGSGLTPPEEVRSHERADHRSVLVPLRFLRLKEIRKRE